jgi:hypothetical protein
MVEAADAHHGLAPYLKLTAGMAARFWIEPDGRHAVAEKP